ncbi:ABC transporter substrate-binding protein [Paraburkholderia antibiotica]|uniref:ABC transporter substrate-binding protein n=1 Tax=Paraburkholderia antibiotica TaxID=2728839 RepID=A0A7X9X732_9BURK|nr:ABC transporter substrate-binding protein [Paraburkholderia antibiotica]NML32595.1 ABC transporter substrate-binding protein [Paraburkholderia antibiotica]
MTTKLSIVLGPHGQVSDLRDGTVGVQGFGLEFTEKKRMPDAYREMARSQPYDICEMAPTSYLMAVAAGAPITALAIPMTRRFRHAGTQRLRSSSIRNPKDLEGRSVGVRAYSVTAAVWTRGIFADEYGVDPDRITWVTEEEENVQSFATPSNVKRLAEGESIAALMKRGELEAAFGGLAGAGNDLEDELVEIVDDAGARERDWFERTGIYPLHGMIVVRNDVLERHPTLAGALFDAFTQAKVNYLERIRNGTADGAEDKRYRKLSAWVGDPLPYGFGENEPSLAALVRYAYRQKLIPAEPPLHAVFHDPRRTSSTDPVQREALAAANRS